MFPKFSEVLAALGDLKLRGIVLDYAIFGAVAQLFWDEAISTFDLDVLVLLPSKSGRLISLEELYAWATEKEYGVVGEHIVIGEIPVQFAPARDALHEEAVRQAATLDFEGTPIRVVRPEYLIATWLQPPANNLVRKERAARLRESVQLDQVLLDDLMQRFGLSW